MITKEEAQKEIEKLVQRFDEQKESYKKNYDETQTRGDFINPFWKALGWDIYNESGYAESYRDVIQEPSIKEHGVTKKTNRPDYYFRASGMPLFFLEAKTPSTFVKDDKNSAYQIRRYGWSAKMSISILTNFEELAIYDCTIKPNLADKANIGRIEYIPYSKYINEFDFIWNTFSKESVLKGSLDKYIQSDKSKKSTITVDKDFLISLDKWRIKIATNIAFCNKGISEDELNFIVQQLIDRIIFLRIAEDRNIESQETLKTHIKKGNYYKNLFKQFEDADGKYNSGLFDFKKDTISKNIKIDNKIIETIINELYPPKSPYEFSVISVEILGSAYEQFLGKQILLSKSGSVTIKKKPEVRNAQGVYYTPQYIVNYIVKNTIGKLIENKIPEEVSNIKIVDPACGSGSFLIGAYQYLLNWHKDYYTKNNKQSKGNKNDPLTPFGELAITEKKRILLNNIYGVDLDSNAVEVTKLSLLLKCMEGETQASIKQLSLFNERVLPTLDENIKNGNSLIGTDFYTQGYLELTDDDMIKVNCFDWDKEFEDIFKNGGFDVVIGNPPYIFTRELIIDSQRKYFYEKYINTQFKLNTYILFSEKAYNILSDKGCFGFIIPNNWLTLEYASEFRKFIIENTGNIKILTSEDKVFVDANVDISILVYEKTGFDDIEFFILNDKQIIQIGKTKKHKILKNHNFVLNYKNNLHSSLQTKIEKSSISLQKIAEVKNGVQAYTVGEGIPKQTKNIKENRVYHSNKKIDKTWIKYVDGVDVKRYLIGWSGQYIKYGNNLSRPRKYELFTQERILVRQIPSKPPYAILATLVNEVIINDNNSMIIKILERSTYSLKYILGILNSKLISYWFVNKFGKLQRKLFPQFKINELREFIIPDIDLNIKSNIKKHDNIVSFVDKIIELKKKEVTETNPQQKIMISRQIKGIDNAIDKLVYEIYNLTEEEIKIVEGL
jgi:hypothetical protein